MPKSLSMAKIAQLAGLPNASGKAFLRKFRMYKDEVGGRLEVHGGDSDKVLQTTVVF
jgi:hypothetical protein